MAAVRYANQRGFGDVVYVSADGYVLEGARASVIAMTGRNLVTPPAQVGILRARRSGRSGAEALRSGWAATTGMLTVGDLCAADAVWLVSSVTLAARVTAIDSTVMTTADGAIFGPGRPGRRLLTATTSVAVITGYFNSIGP